VRSPPARPFDFTGGDAVLDLLDHAGFAGAIDDQGPTDQVNISCFAAGTRILTATGEVPVEALQRGDRLVTTHGRKMIAVLWLGHRQIDCARHPRPGDAWPVRIKAGAFAQNVPHHDLLLSPDHAVFIGGTLIPSRHLINGTTILQRPVRQVTYFHFELPMHDAILAEGMPAESYLDTGNRLAFANGSGCVGSSARSASSH
jgi:hypothetical protein